MTELKGATVLVTGATGGFGQALTRQLYALGNRLILTDLDAEALHALKQDLLQQDEASKASKPNPDQRQASPKGEVVADITADLASTAGCETLIQAVQALNAPVDILINNAGVGLFGRLDEVPTERWEQLIQLNLVTPMRLSRALMPSMIKRQRGHIVNIASIAGWEAPAGLSHYGASKYGLRGFSEALYRELKPYRVNVSVVYPFFSRTPILQAPRYGSLAESMAGFPTSLATDPDQVMAATLRGIQRNQLHIFPDRIARSISLIKRYFPASVYWMSDTLMQYIKTREQDSDRHRNAAE
ncbi:MAG: SDR family NAD(P)-dependent oxidoreductase [Cyanobacteria bacterium P01_H01_bin.121]